MVIGETEASIYSISFCVAATTIGALLTFKSQELYSICSMQNPKLVLLFLKISIISVFLYAAVFATIQPENWIWYIPQFLRDMFPEKLLLMGFSAYQLLLCVWIASGWKAFYAGLLAPITFLGIIAANIGAPDVVFRDFAIFFASIALTIASYSKASKK
jgi:hypothetical protein